jgi:carbon-monoxide dehydrogenase iron sulfur subunit
MRRLYLDGTKCRGCTTCEVACSFKTEDLFRPSVARLYVVKDEWNRIEMPIVCLQCGKCAAVCDREAIHLALHGAYIVDEAKCDGCGDCIYVCPQRVIFLHPETGKAIKCDLCGGEPECVKFCPYGALSFSEQPVITIEKPNISRATITRMDRNTIGIKVVAETQGIGNKKEI